MMLVLHNPRHLTRYRHRRHSWTVLLVIVAPIFLLITAGVIAGVRWTELSAAIGLSFYRLLLGYVISLVLGVGIAIGVGSSKKAEVLLPVLDVLQNVPSFALIPIFAITL